MYRHMTPGTDDSSIKNYANFFRCCRTFAEMAGESGAAFYRFYSSRVLGQRECAGTHKSHQKNSFFHGHLFRDPKSAEGIILERVEMIRRPGPMSRWANF